MTKHIKIWRRDSNTAADFYYKVFEYYRKKHNITVLRWISSENTIAIAYPDERSIVVRQPLNPRDLYVALHEIGHCVKQLRKHVYLSEYLAEQWSLNILKKIGVNCNRFENRAKVYVLFFLLHEYRCGLVDKKDIKSEVLNWLDITKSQLDNVHLMRSYSAAHKSSKYFKSLRKQSKQLLPSVI